MRAPARKPENQFVETAGCGTARQVTHTHAFRTTLKKTLKDSVKRGLNRFVQPSQMRTFEPGVPLIYQKLTESTGKGTISQERFSR